MSNPKILVIEDDASIRQMYCLKLRQLAYGTFEAANGSQGLKTAEEKNPDLILLDLKMPEMNGDEMLEKMRLTEWGQNILVIILTNISADEAPMKLRLLRVERYIVKAHYTPRQVVEVVTETLKRYNKVA